jgi:hypothetical protein
MALIILASFVLQLIAAGFMCFYGFAYNRFYPGKLLLALAMVIMASRRGASLYLLLGGTYVPSTWFVEVTALIVSALMCIGMISDMHTFNRVLSELEHLRQVIKELQQAVVGSPPAGAE